MVVLLTAESASGLGFIFGISQSEKPCVLLYNLGVESGTFHWGLTNFFVLFRVKINEPKFRQNPYSWLLCIIPYTVIKGSTSIVTIGLLYVSKYAQLHILVRMGPSLSSTHRAQVCSLIATVTGSYRRVRWGFSCSSRCKVGAKLS